MARIEKKIGQGVKCCEDNILKDSVILGLEGQNSQLKIQNSILEFNHLMDSSEILNYKINWAVCDYQKKQTDRENDDLLDEVVKETYRKRLWRGVAIAEGSVIAVTTVVSIWIKLKGK